VKDGFRIYDTDTHCSLPAEQLDSYLSLRFRELVPDLASHLREVRIGHAGEVFQPPFRHRYHFSTTFGGWGGSKPRVLGEAEPRQQERRFQTFMGSRFPTFGGNECADIRIKDMDEEGTDVHMMVGNGASGAENPEVEVELIRANHRCLNDMCSQYPHRLKSLIAVSARSIEDSVREIDAWGSSSWAVGIQPFLPLDYPIDHPDLDPIWKAAEEADLVVVHHSFATGYPGYRDLWDNPFLGRSASHPWAAMRFVGAVVCSGMMDRYPRLKFAILESGFGWLPFWARRLDDQMVYVGYVNENLRHKPSEYLQSGRFFASIELHEGPEMLRMVSELMGDDLLMLGTDYPHAESRFPESDKIVLSWMNDGVSKDQMNKLVWDNPVRCFGKP
jgi:predicted TIM-barrel fold metal-dependent hydrolase